MVQITCFLKYIYLIILGDTRRSKFILCIFTWAQTRFSQFRSLADSVNMVRPPSTILLYLHEDWSLGSGWDLGHGLRHKVGTRV